MTKPKDMTPKFCESCQARITVMNPSDLTGKHCSNKSRCKIRKFWNWLNDKLFGESYEKK